MRSLPFLGLSLLPPLVLSDCVLRRFQSAHVQGYDPQQCSRLLGLERTVRGPREFVEPFSETGDLRRLNEIPSCPPYFMVCEETEPRCRSFSSGGDHGVLIDYMGYRIRDRPGEIFVDVGGNRGFFSLYAANLGLCTIYFEIQKYFLGNVAFSALANGVEDRFFIFQQGVSRSSSSMTFKHFDGVAHLAEGGEGDTMVPVEPLDSVIQQPVAMLKIDVEGFEMCALEGAQRLVFEHGASFMAFEIGPARWSRCGTTLAEGTELMQRVSEHYDSFVSAHCRESFKVGEYLEKETRSFPGDRWDRFELYKVPRGAWPQLIAEMAEKDADCNFWFEHKEAAAKTGEGVPSGHKWPGAYSSTSSKTILAVVMVSVGIGFLLYLCACRKVAGTLRRRRM
uniref:Methyltransferase FkbM domain-containing protein n=1 Tax=Chromera velia CCMP2878 TaxID=1169474 RepID=A0A0G4FRL3_9ALVE|mmetsp:Transcript_12158/g.23519  ORF Transcript_12158/g.23519 Transcript_12158/m.23519 type:complete len:394 (+) Transcript_12158:273-1454(+)|eukprot:Cvel_3643.t1-p1 / transcript=Cvel_3643.t1 / gene=Cvel_3643 / organism=Chromera_velia_CCMP2878 / gene_product=hypothetical protein / transcript_product=hypothetical protein / location=Cvel_scaffold150:75970-77148(-) / protein_length=393 / sequence_SO=supercontig / SO=protein_coding / is_pseudo=false